MKNCAIICEYNPFHTGHKYQFDRVRERGVDNIFCIMSGNFVQSAMPAFCDKSIRAECAVLGGANAVIELPTLFATASAQYFAEGAVKIISGIKDIKYLAMGAVADRDDILRLAEIRLKHENTYNDLLKANLKNGKSYNMSCIAALSTLYSRFFGENNIDAKLLSDPNGILCLEYISAIHKYAANIEPMIVKRSGSSYNDISLCGEFVSATAIRNAAANDRFAEARRYLPYNYDKITAWRAEHAPDIKCYKSLAVFALKNNDTENIKNLRDCSEGMEFLLKNISNMYDFDRYIDTLIGKRYGKKRISRLFLDIILNIQKRYLNNRFCTRLLACKADFDFKLLPDTVKTTNAAIKSAASADTQVDEVLKIDLSATALYNTVSRIDGDYFNYSLIKL